MYKILVVDDEEKIRELIGKYAKFEGHEVDFAADGMQAIEKCRDNTYDIVIMDIMMPNLDACSSGTFITAIVAAAPIFLWYSSIAE